MKPLLIGLAGRAGAGKDTVGGIIKEELNRRGYGVQLVSFAEPLKKICREVYAFTDEQMTTQAGKIAGDVRYPRPDGTLLTPREAMQVCGTEFGRRCYPNTWVDYGLRRARGFNAAGISAVFTDVRFINEAQAIREAGGQVWRVRRPAAEAVPATHVSETEMDTDRFNDFVEHWVFNDCSIEHLASRVKELLP